MSLGVHCSIRNGYLNALYEAKKLGCSCLQMFTHSPRVWKFKYPDKDTVEKFKCLRRELNLSPLVIHTAYLPNPASSNQLIYQKTKELLYLEFELAEIFCADYVVMHVGSYSEGKTLKDGINQVVEALDFCFNKISKKFKNIRFMLLLENVCGEGRKIGRTISELSKVIKMSRYSKYIGICFDTAHGFSYGYNITSDEGNKKLIREIKDNLGFDKLKLIHLNDSKVPLGSKIDQHYHIGKGYIGIEGFKTFLSYFPNIPIILETPKEAPFNKLSKKDIQNLNIVKKLLEQIS